MISADVSSALIGASNPLRAPPAPPPNVTRTVAPPKPAERGSGGSVSSNSGESSRRAVIVPAGRRSSSGAPVNLARSARTYAALLELTGDANVAAMFSGFGRSLRGGGGVDLYA